MATTDNAIQYDIKILEHLEQYLDLTPEELRVARKFVQMGLIQRDRVVELAIAKVGGYDIVSVNGQDFCDGSDAKSVVSSARNNYAKKGQWRNSFVVPGIRAKTGPLRIVAYNKVLNKFQYFFVPKEKYAHLASNVLDITIETHTSYSTAPTFTGINKKSAKWWDCEELTFEAMAKKAA